MLIRPAPRIVTVNGKTAIARLYGPRVYVQWGMASASKVGVAADLAAIAASGTSAALIAAGYVVKGTP